MGAAHPNPACYDLYPSRTKEICGNLAMRLDVLGDVPALDPFEIFGVKQCFRHQLNESHGGSPFTGVWGWRLRESRLTHLALDNCRATFWTALGLFACGAEHPALACAFAFETLDTRARHLSVSVAIIKNLLPHSLPEIFLGAEHGMTDWSWAWAWAYYCTPSIFFLI